eukprot:9292675-Pyramimonas_sp.AAC.1
MGPRSAALRTPPLGPSVGLPMGLRERCAESGCEAGEEGGGEEEREEGGGRKEGGETRGTVSSKREPNITGWLGETTTHGHVRASRKRRIVEL